MPRGKQEFDESQNKSCHSGACRLRAGIWAGSKPLCSWHDSVEMKKDSEIHFRAFQEWHKDLLASLYCNFWTHHSAEYLWSQVNGQNFGKVDGETPCKVKACTVLARQDEAKYQNTKVLKFDFAVEDK